MIGPDDVPVDLDLLELIHDVALGQATWGQVMVCLQREFAARDALLLVYGTRPGQVQSLGAAGGSPLPWDQYAEHFAAIDPFAAAMHDGSVFEPGVVTTGDQVVPASAFVASEFYNDWFRPNDVRHTAGAYVPVGPGRRLQLGVPRAPDAGPYGSGELARLQRYFNHIRRAVLIGDARGAGGGGPDHDGFAARYRLTPAESVLIQGLIETGSLKRLAQSGGKSYNTLRAQLQAVFAKTGTHSQVELIRLIHQGRGDV